MLPAGNEGRGLGCHAVRRRNSGRDSRVATTSAAPVPEPSPHSCWRGSAASRPYSPAGECESSSDTPFFDARPRCGAPTRGARSRSLVGLRPGDALGTGGDADERCPAPRSRHHRTVQKRPKDLRDLRDRQELVHPRPPVFEAATPRRALSLSVNVSGAPSSTPPAGSSSPARRTRSRSG